MGAWNIFRSSIQNKWFSRSSFSVNTTKHLLGICMWSISRVLYLWFNHSSDKEMVISYTTLAFFLTYKYCKELIRSWSILVLSYLLLDQVPENLYICLCGNIMPLMTVCHSSIKHPPAFNTITKWGFLQNLNNHNYNLASVTWYPFFIPHLNKVCEWYLSSQLSGAHLKDLNIERRPSMASKISSFVQGQC